MAGHEGVLVQKVSANAALDINAALELVSSRRRGGGGMTGAGGMGCVYTL